MTNPTDPRVEAAAREMCLSAVDGDERIWNEMSERDKNFYRRRCALILRAADAAAWLPIETSPFHQEIIIAWKTGTTSVGTKYGTGWKFSNGDEMYGVHAASGWQHLPKSP